MTPYQFNIIIPANNAAPVNLAAAAITASKYLAGSLAGGTFSSHYLPACKITFQMARGGTGPGYIGPINILFDGTNAMKEVAAATTTVPGGGNSIESYKDRNTLNLADYYAHGVVPGDVMLVTYWQD